MTKLPLPSTDFHILLTLRKGLHSLKAHVQCCDESLSRIRSRSEQERAAERPGKRKAIQKPQ